MAKGVNKNTAKGCGIAFLVLLVLGIVIQLMGVILGVAVGVALWFGIRYVWRRLVIEAPKSHFVKRCMKIPPIGRKVLAGCICALVAFIIMGVSSAPSETETATINPEPTAEQPATDETPAEEPAEPELSDMTVTFIDVAQGDSALVELPDGKVMLIDAGEASASQNVLDALEAADVDEIDYLVASHPHSDHIGGMEAVLDAYKVKEVWAPDAPDTTDTYAGFLDAVEAEGLTINAAEEGETIVDDEAGYEVELLAPAEGTESDDMNDYSAIVRVTYGDTAFLFTGDASASEIVAANPGDVDVLKAAHHGSETGTDAAVLSETTPEHVVMSYAEGNSYGHPDQSVLDAVSAAGATAYSTAANGDITCVSDGEEVTVTTERTGDIVAGMTAEERAAAEAEAQAQAEAEAQAQAEAQQQQQQSKTVVITPSGSKYHNPGCRTLNRSRSLTELTEDEAIARGYEPCGVCNP